MFIYLPMIIRAGVADKNSTKVPRSKKMILPLASQRSLRGAEPTRGRAKEAIAGKMRANNAMFTPARKESNSPA
jgi:hypothetical protein